MAWGAQSIYDTSIWRYHDQDVLEAPSKLLTSRQFALFIANMVGWRWLVVALTSACWGSFGKGNGVIPASGNQDWPIVIPKKKEKWIFAFFQGIYIFGDDSLSIYIYYSNMFIQLPIQIPQTSEVDPRPRSHWLPDRCVPSPHSEPDSDSCNCGKTPSAN